MEDSHVATGAADFSVKVAGQSRLLFIPFCNQTSATRLNYLLAPGFFFFYFFLLPSQYQAHLKSRCVFDCLSKLVVKPHEVISFPLSLGGDSHKSQRPLNEVSVLPHLPSSFSCFLSFSLHALNW